MIDFVNCPFMPNRSQFRSNLHRTSHTGRHQSEEEIFRFSRLWGQKSRSRSDENRNPVNFITKWIRTKTYTNWRREAQRTRRQSEYVFKVIGSKVKFDFSEISASPRSAIDLVWISAVPASTALQQSDVWTLTSATSNRPLSRRFTGRRTADASGSVAGRSDTAISDWWTVLAVGT